MHHEDVVAHRRQHLQAGLESIRIEKVRNHDREPRLPRAAAELHERVAQIRGARGLHRFEHFEHAEDAALAAAGLHFLPDDLVERQHRDAIEMREADVTERGRDASRLIELGRLRASTGSYR